eukprot:1519037-Amphidinium_carterae.1
MEAFQANSFTQPYSKQHKRIEKSPVHEEYVCPQQRRHSLTICSSGEHDASSLMSVANSCYYHSGGDSNGLSQLCGSARASLDAKLA